MNDVDHLLGAAIRSHSEARPGDAATFCRRALSIEPSGTVPLHLLGISTMSTGWLMRALGTTRAPEPLLGDLGVILVETGRHAEAAAAFRRLLSLSPGQGETIDRLTEAFVASGALQDAETWSRRGTRLDPFAARRQEVLGFLLQSRGAYVEAAIANRRAIVLGPSTAATHYNLGIVNRQQGLGEAAVAELKRSLAIRQDLQETSSALIFCLNYSSAHGPADLLAAARRWDRTHGTVAATPARKRQNATPLRIGYVSGDLRRHPVGYMMTPVMEAHDRSRVEVHCFTTDPVEDALTRRIKAAAQGWHTLVGVDDDTAATMVRSVGIDVLVDLSGHTARSRLPLFARRPAPVQATWMGYFGTTGVKAIDHLLADRYLIPDEDRRWFTETVTHLPEGYVCYAPPDEAPPVAPPPSDRAGSVTFGCFNNLAKVTPAAIAVWAAILRRISGSTLLLKAGGLDIPSARARILREFGAHGVPAGRISLEGWSPYADLLARYGDVDIALDPFPFCGGLTTLETLWMGVPLVTLIGDRFAGRQSLSHLSVLGQSDLAAATIGAYVDLAVALASDASRRRRMRADQRDRMARSPLCDGARFTRGLESAFISMHAGTC